MECVFSEKTCCIPPAGQEEFHKDKRSSVMMETIFANV